MEPIPNGFPADPEPLFPKIAGRRERNIWQYRILFFSPAYAIIFVYTYEKGTVFLCGMIDTAAGFRRTAPDPREGKWKTVSSKILIFGDICPDNDYRSLFDRCAEGPFSPELAQEIRESELAAANLECPATDNRTPITKCGPNLRAEPKDIALLRQLGFRVLSLANNHILDFGLTGVEDTLRLCAENGIHTAGAGETAQAAAKPLLVEAAGKRIGFLSYAEAEFNLATEASAGANHFDPYTAYDEVRRLKEAADYIIVLYHGGIEYHPYPSPLLQKKCRAFAEAGADLVLCQHSHCIGTYEKIGDCTILYGQGNSVFGYREGNPTWNEGLLVEADPETREVRFRLLHAAKEGIGLADEAASLARVRKMEEDSKLLDRPEALTSEWRRFCRTMAPMDLPLLYGRGRVFNKLNRMLRNRLIDTVYSRWKKTVTMNLLRCEAHHEVVTTILEEEILY